MRRAARGPPAPARLRRAREQQQILHEVVERVDALDDVGQHRCVAAVRGRRPPMT